MMQLCPMAFRAKPAIPELDFAGYVVEVGPEVPKARDLAPGTPVFGTILVGPHVSAGVGALAEYVVVPANCVVRKPDSIDLGQAATLAVAGCAALSLLESAKLKKGDRVLINGASGGIGTMILQMARREVGKEGKIVAICSEKNLECVKGLGADEAIDYKKHAPLHKYLAATYSANPFTVIIDAYGVQEIFSNCATYLVPRAPFISVGIAFASYTYSSVMYACFLMLTNSLWPRFLGGVNRPYNCVQGFATFERLQQLAEMAEEGDFEVVIDSSWELEDALGAYEKMLSRHARGKIVVKVQNTPKSSVA